MTGTFNLNSFLTEINTKSILQPSKHLTWFNCPGALASLTDPNALREIVMRCHISNLPDIALDTVDTVRKFGIGPTEKVPFMTQFREITTSFIVDGGGDIHRFFHGWINYIINHDMSKGFGNTNAFGFNPYEVAYKDDYVTTLIVASYDVSADAIIQVFCRDAYPMAIDAVQLDWGENDSFMRLTVTWAFTDWYSQYGQPTGLSSLTADIANLTSGSAGSAIKSVLTATQSLASISRETQAVVSTINSISNLF